MDGISVIRQSRGGRTVWLVGFRPNSQPANFPQNCMLDYFHGSQINPAQISILRLCTCRTTLSITDPPCSTTSPPQLPTSTPLSSPANTTNPHINHISSRRRRSSNSTLKVPPSLSRGGVDSS